MSDNNMQEPERKERVSYDKCDRAEMARRVELVLGLVINGASIGQIFRFVTDQPGLNGQPPKDSPKWNVSLRTVELYVGKALAKLEASNAQTRTRRIALARRRYENIMAKAIAAGDLGVAERAVRSIARLDGLDAPMLHAVAGTVHHEHGGTVEHEHTHRAATLEERAEGVRTLFNLAAERKRRGKLPEGAPVATIPPPSEAAG